MNVQPTLLLGVFVAGISLSACSGAGDRSSDGNAAGEVAQAPAFTTGAEVIGRSVEGRLITATSIGSGSRTVVIIGGLHTGVEAETVALVDRLQREFAEDAGTLPRDVRLVFIASANPDGLEFDVRTNANDVDLNRNWRTHDWTPDAIHGDAAVFGGDAPLSEPETRALHDYLLDLDPSMVLSIHGFAGVVQHNREGAAERLAESFGDAADFEVIDEWPHYEVTGELIEALAEDGIPAADVELLEDDHDSYERVLRGLEAVIRTLRDGPEAS